MEKWCGSGSSKENGAAPSGPDSATGVVEPEPVPESHNFGGAGAATWCSFGSIKKFYPEPEPHQYDAAPQHCLKTYAATLMITPSAGAALKWWRQNNTDTDEGAITRMIGRISNKISSRISVFRILIYRYSIHYYRDTLISGHQIQYPAGYRT
jgi:hypothetical protein